MKINRRSFFKWFGIGTIATLTNPGKLIAKIPADENGEIIIDKMSWVAEEDWEIITHAGIFVDDKLIQIVPVDYNHSVVKDDTVSLAFAEPIITKNLTGSFTVGLFSNGEEITKKGYLRRKI